MHNKKLLLNSKCKMKFVYYIVTYHLAGPRYTKTFSVEVEVNSPFLIRCEVPYVTQACYILSPNRTRYSPDIPTRAQLGECTLTVKKASETDDGEWSCLYVKKNEITAEEVKFQVSPG